ncbi:MAG TPA: DUF3866 family protein [Actinomycetota bacterium]|nr:DUF3866 family protein [Actinomycetota bacterium]
MIRIRRGVVLEVESPRPGVLRALVEVEGEKEQAIVYPSLSGPVRPGDRVVLNTGAVALGLGTGGMHFVIAVEGGADVDPPDHAGHAMKLRYTPLQHAVEAVEETHREALDSFTGLAGMPVVVAPLHSALAPVVVAAGTVRPHARLAFVMTEGGALPMAFSETVAALKDAGLLDTTVTCGQAFGGDLEAVNRFSGIAAAKAVAQADVIVACAGPGNLGTGSRLGHASIDAGETINAIAALGGRPIVAPRISFADPRERHRGISHHTIGALSVAALVGTEIALPPLAPERREEIVGRLGEAHLLDIHRVVDVELGDDVEAALRSSPVRLESMGRTFDDDPDYFRAGAAAAVLAARVR